MIAEPTLLILGAGSSIPYDFPSGATLLSKLCRLYNNRDSRDGLQALRNMGFPDDAVESFCNHLYATGQYSIDRFLYINPHLSSIGKTAIAALLLQNEKLSEDKPHSVKEDWYRYLWNCLAYGPDRTNSQPIPPIKFGENKLKILTFNYERSLEHYLARAIAATFRIDYEDANALRAEHIEIFHVYGQLGDISRASRSHVPYGANLTPLNLKRAADGITTIHERDLDNAFQETIRDLMYWARRVCFLGFGYDKKNLQLLQLQTLKARMRIDHGISVYGSTYGLEEAEARIAEAAIKEYPSHHVTANAVSEEFLRKTGVFLY